MEKRLRKRYWELVDEHRSTAQAIASGIHSVPDANTPWACTQAAYRFFKNPRVTLRGLVRPLLDAAREEVPVACDEFVLAVHDWSQLMYPTHSSKKDRVRLSSRSTPDGYEMFSTLLVSDRDGAPLAPVALSLRAGDGVHCSRHWRVRQPLSPLDELDPAMTFVEQQDLGRPVVHIIDAEADSVDHYRQWSQRPQRWFLVRADNRLVEHEGQERSCAWIQQELREQRAFHYARPVKYHGRRAHQWVAERSVWLVRPGSRKRPAAGDVRRVPGPPLALRLIIAEVRDNEGQVLATWYLLTNVPNHVPAATIALWYYWRWDIESYHKLIKSAGMQAEEWQQESAAAIAKRLLVVSMTCVTVWKLARSVHPQAEPARRLLIRLSGRQMKRNQPFTMPALLSGMWVLLAMMHVLETYPLDELRELADLILQSGPPPPVASRDV